MWFRSECCARSGGNGKVESLFVGIMGKSIKI